MTRPQILFIDAYDSFTNNIISLVETELGAEVTTIHIDSEVGDLGRFIERFDAVLAGPGPGDSQRPADVGHIAELWKLDSDHVRPVLGVCLGFQSLVYAFGGKIKRLSQPRHGISTQVTTCGSGLFEDISTFDSIQYHSLRGCFENTEPIWQPSGSHAVLAPLAWDLSSAENQAILMSVGHTSRPFWGIQFHPESICSSQQSKKIIKNWWALCLDWYATRQQDELERNTRHLRIPDVASLAHSSSNRSSMSLPRTFSSSTSLSSMTSCAASRVSSSPINEYACRSISMRTLGIPDIVACLGLDKKELIVLDSERRLMPGLGRYSIISVLDADTTKLCYSSGSSAIRLITRQHTIVKELDSPRSVFKYLKDFLHERKIDQGNPDLPFWGGLIGYITYEACLETINIESPRKDGRDDISFAFVERSIVLDHVDGTLYIQSIKPMDDKWLDSTIAILEEVNMTTVLRSAPPELTRANLPGETNYKSKILQCQEQIRAGNSYELCLTNQASFTTKKTTDSPWQKYQTLRTLNSAPFASYLRLGPVTILSTSPERFMHWTRPSQTSEGTLTSTCQFRPIKGTVQKNTPVLPDGKIPRTVSLEEAKRLLSTPKETAENLMIVDLIRHDLHGVVGSGNVRVPSLMQVEEYSTVYQLVSVIEGDLHTAINPPITNTTTNTPTSTTTTKTSGTDVLASSLPPGSMTGAPKKRSCEILQELEDEPRSVYSGVIGYMCVGGGGDFSVTIRTVFKWDDEDEFDQEDQQDRENGDDDGDGKGSSNGSSVWEKWRIGAGGAITVLSDEQGEWDEMLGKLASTRRLFG